MEVPSERRPFRERASGEIFAIEEDGLLGSYPRAEDPGEETDTLAVVTIHGALEHHGRAWSWFDSYDQVAKRLEDAFAGDARAVIMRIDSPGGVADGAFELHDKIRRLRKSYGKPLFAFADETMSSAAYAIGCGADEIWMPKGAHVGSIGVIGELVDVTESNRKAGVKIVYLTTGKRKADLRPDRVLTEEIVESRQRKIDYYGDLFFRAVAAARELDVEAVIRMEADTFFGRDAVRAGLADGVSSWESFVARVGRLLDGTEKTGGTLKDIRATKDSTTSTHEKTPMKKSLLKLVSERDAAEAALLGEKDPKKRKALAASFAAAVTTLAEAKSEKHVKHEEHTVTDDPADEDEDDEDDDDDSDDDDDDDGDEDSDEEADEDEADEEEADEDADEEEADGEAESKKVKALDSARASLRAAKRSKNKPAIGRARASLRALKDVLASSPKQSITAQVTKVTAKRNAKLERRTARLEASVNTVKVDRLLERAKLQGKFAPTERAALREIGLSSRKQLKDLLATRAAGSAVRTSISRPGLPTVESQRQSMGANLRGKLADQDEETRTMVSEASTAMGIDPEKFFDDMRRRGGAATVKGVLS